MKAENTGRFLYYIRQDKIPVRQRKAAEMVRISDIIRAELD